MTETKLQQLDFWTKCKNYIRSKNSKILLRTPRPQHWFSISIGSSLAHAGLTINTKEKILGCELYIDRNKDLFNYLRSKKKIIEKEIGESAEWIDARVASRILVQKNVGSIFDPNHLDSNFKWFYDRAILFQKIFGKYIKEFNE